MAIKEHKIFVALSEETCLFSRFWRYLYRKSYGTT